MGDAAGRVVDFGSSELFEGDRSEEHTSELQSLRHLVCRLLLEKKNNIVFQILQPPYMVTSSNVNLAIDYLQPKQFIKPARKSVTMEKCKITVEARAVPDIPVKC